MEGKKLYKIFKEKYAITHAINLRVMQQKNAY